VLLRVYFYPLLFLFGSYGALLVFGEWIPSRFAVSPLLSMLGESSYQFAPWVGAGFLIIAVMWFSYSSYRLWQWYYGHGDFCYECGGVTDFKIGKYGAYYKCLACGRSHRDY
jgi:hypothetical protein